MTKKEQTKLQRQILVALYNGPEEVMTIKEIIPFTNYPAELVAHLLHPKASLVYYELIETTVRDSLNYSLAGSKNRSFDRKPGYKLTGAGKFVTSLYDEEFKNIIKNQDLAKENDKKFENMERE